MTIAVFDSGRGAYFVAERLRPHFPEHDFRVVTDSEHVPYGDRSQDEITALVEKALEPVLDECEIIILACNTATAASIDKLRADYPKHRFIGFEPMIKPAAQLTDSQKVTILATTATRQSDRYQALVKEFGDHLTIIEPDTSNWALLIEEGNVDEIDLSKTVSSVNAQDADVVALACTHYLALEPRLRGLLPNTTIIEPTPAVTRQLMRLLEPSLPQ